MLILEPMHLVRDWVIKNAEDSTSQPIQYGVGYTFENTTIRQSLIYGSRKYGINLKWTPRDNLDNIKFERSSASRGPIKYGEAISIHVQNGGYLYYKEREYGINLNWSKTPKYEWEIRTGEPNESTDTIYSTFKVALYNKAHEDYLVYHDRQYGINLRWAKDCPKKEKEKEKESTATVILSVREGPSSQPSRENSTNRFLWTFTPINLTGASGKSIGFSIDRTYTSFQSNVAPAEWYDIYRELAPKLRTGKWRIRIQDPGWTTECEVLLQSGNNYVNFSKNRIGCTQGLIYPQ